METPLLILAAAAAATTRPPLLDPVPDRGPVYEAFQLIVIIWSILGPALMLLCREKKLLARLSVHLWDRWDSVLEWLHLFIGGPLVWLHRAYGTVRHRWLAREV